MNRSQKHRVANVVSCTEGGDDFIEGAFLELRKWDAIPDISKEPHVESLHKLNEDVDDKALEAAIKAVREHPYFKPHLDGHPAMLGKARNEVPSDVSVVYRYPEGQFQLSRWFAVALQDPSGPIFVDPRLVPATKERKLGDLRRRVFCVHELADFEDLVEMGVFQSIYRNNLDSWFSIVTARDAEFTWVLTFWCRLRTLDDIRIIRGGLEMLAESLSKSAEAYRKQEQQTVICGDSLRQGMLVLSPSFKEVRRQNYAAESIMRRFRDASGERLDRGLLYERFKSTCQKLFAQGLPATWQVDEFGRESARGAVVLSAEALGGDVMVRLMELTPAPPETPALSGLVDYTEPSGLVTHVKKQQRAVYVPSLKRVARPVREDDLIADRIYQYKTITGTDLKGKKAKARLNDSTPYALLFREEIVGLLLPM